jgi:hypothetical protein
MYALPGCGSFGPACYVAPTGVIGNTTRHISYQPYDYHGYVLSVYDSLLQLYHSQEGVNGS